MNQKGFAPILIIVLLLAGIGVGAYLVGQKTNLLPKAQEYTSADGGECRDNPRLAPPPDKNKYMSEEDRKLYDYYWKADCSRRCVDFDRSTDCPASDLGADNTRWCYGFKDAGYCLRLQIVKTGTSVDVSNTDRFRESSGKKPATTYTAGTGTGSTQACTTAQVQQIANTYYDAKIAQRYARYTAILSGAKEYCVQADLGVEEPGLRENSKDGTVKNGRLYLCSGANSTKEKLDLVWRVISDDGAHIQESTKENPGPDKSKVEAVMGKYITLAKQKLGI